MLLCLTAAVGVFLAKYLLRLISQSFYERVTWVVISVSGVRLAFM